jgi:molybdate transport system permease protein
VRPGKVDKFSRALAIVAALFIALPIFALLWSVPWSTFFTEISSHDSIQAIKLSTWTSLLATLISVLLGIPLAWYLAKGNSKFTNLLRPIVLAPIVLPPTVAGLALLALFGRNGIFGSKINEITGWSIPFTSVAVVIVGIFVGMPFFTLIVESGFRQLSSDIEDAAETDGVSKGKLLTSISIPQIKGVIAIGALLAWARAIGEFGATVMFAGSLPGVTQTWPMLVYQELDIDAKRAYSLSAIMLIISILIVFALRKQIKSAFNN